MLLRHICETCGTDEILDSTDAFELGWDYPPRMGTFGLISARTCPNCPISGTLWWALAVDKTDVAELSETQKKTLERILNEPESILVQK